MTVTLVFLTLLLAVFVGWLVSQTINVKPWIAQSATAGHVRHVPKGATAPRLGLAVFLAVVTALFALTISAYLMRMEHGADWRALPEPNLLWINTGILLLGSVALQWAWGCAKRNNRDGLSLGLSAGGAFTITFIAGQYLVWRQLNATGYYMTANPANAFFFLLTALHALHLVGGLVAWARTLRKLWSGAEPSQVRASVELCALYWHFLLVIWAVLFALVLST